MLGKMWKSRQERLKQKPKQTINLTKHLFRFFLPRELQLKQQKVSFPTLYKIYVSQEVFINYVTSHFLNSIIYCSVLLCSFCFQVFCDFSKTQLENMCSRLRTHVKRKVVTYDSPHQRWIYPLFFSSSKPYVHLRNYFVCLFVVSLSLTALLSSRVYEIEVELKPK